MGRKSLEIIFVAYMKRDKTIRDGNPVLWDYERRAIKRYG